MLLHSPVPIRQSLLMPSNRPKAGSQRRSKDGRGLLKYSKGLCYRSRVQRYQRLQRVCLAATDLAALNLLDCVSHIHRALCRGVWNCCRIFCCSGLLKPATSWATQQVDQSNTRQKSNWPFKCRLNKHYVSLF